MTKFMLPGWGLVSVPHSSLFPARDIPSPRQPPPPSLGQQPAVQEQGAAVGGQKGLGWQSSSPEIRAPGAAFAPRRVWHYEILGVGHGVLFTVAEPCHAAQVDSQKSE